MPSGAYVKIEVHNWGMNLYTFVPGEDMGKLQGLCGTFDGNPDNDMKAPDQDILLPREDFIDSWR